MASDDSPVPLPEALSSLLGACGFAPKSTSLPRGESSDTSGSDSKLDGHMDNVVSGKPAKRKRKLAAASLSPHLAQVMVTTLHSLSKVLTILQLCLTLVGAASSYALGDFS